MSTTAKALKMAAELADRLKVLSGFAALGIVVSSDTDQNPLITLGSSVATGAEAAIVKIEPVSWPLAQDILGNTANQFTPHVVKLLWEASSGGGFTAKDRAQLVATAAKMGCKVELYQSTSGAGVVLADIDNSAKLVAEIEADPYYPMISSQ